MEACLITFRVFSILFFTGVMAGSPCPIEVMRKIITDMNCSEMTVSIYLCLQKRVTRVWSIFYIILSRILST